MSLSEKSPTTTAAKSQLFFLDRSERYAKERPYLCHFALERDDDEKRTNLKFSPHDLEFYDMRDCTEQPSLSTNGFEWVQPPHQYEPDEVRRSAEDRRSYCIRTEEYLKTYLNAQHAFTYQTLIRKLEAPRPVTDGQEHFEQVRNNKPIQSVHLDYSPATCTQIKDRVIGEAISQGWIKAEEKSLLEQCRFELINTWRPLSTVETWPLAFCDFRTVDMEADSAVVDQVHSTWVDESLIFYYSDRYKWYYISRQEPQDVVLFRLYSSDNSPYAVHGSGPLLDANENAAPRESIETRLVIFHTQSS